jgi:hypothetical protein
MGEGGQEGVLMREIEVRANIGKEVAEISRDFTHPIEVIREALHNAYDAGASTVEISALIQKLPDGRRVLTVEVLDDGVGMTAETLEAFFGLGLSEKPKVADRRLIGFKGHGTKIYYQAQELYVASRGQDTPLVCAGVKRARESVYSRVAPRPQVYEGEEASSFAGQYGLRTPDRQGSFLRLVDFTPESGRLIDDFKTFPLENYIRWFTVFGSFEHVVKRVEAVPPLRLLLRGTDLSLPREVPFGHPWPLDDRTSVTQLRKLDDRRPFNYFRKTFRFPSYVVEGGYQIDVAVLFEGKRGRLERDKGITRQRAGGLYAEEERYGVWLCRDYIPVEFKSEWLLDEACPRIFPDLRNPLIMINCQDFMLIANRGSVGNSPQPLLAAVKDGLFKILDEVQDDPQVARFLSEYQEDLFGRLREKDKKALQRRIERYNQKQRLTITLPGGKRHEFWEPQREITLFGLISELQLLDATLLGFEILDYDDHHGIDLLVRRNGTGELLDRQKVAYVELKYELGAQVNHAFDHLFGIVCWDTFLTPNAPVADAAGHQFTYQESKDAQNITHSHLVPPPGGPLNHNVRVLVLKRLLTEGYHLVARPNPRPIKR